MVAVNNEKIYGYIGTAVYILLLILLLLFLKLRYSQTIEVPAGGVDIDLGTTETGWGDNNPKQSSSSSGGFATSEETLTNDTEEEDVVSETKINKVKTTSTSQNNNNSQSNQNKNSESDDLWNQAANNASSSQGNKGGKGNQGNPDGTDGSTGSTPCKGCTGGGSLGNGDALKLVVPDIKNQDEGVIVVKVKVDKEGNVVEVKEYGNKGTVGNLSEESYRKAREAALKTKFAPDPKANELRTGYIRYNLQRN
ncbi:MAG: hypothetical protein N2167_05595 [Flavobacteriales bacterium]|nr:hypothetical protein [Flavobacteriales bacterium]